MTSFSVNYMDVSRYPARRPPAPDPVTAGDLTSNQRYLPQNSENRGKQSGRNSFSAADTALPGNAPFSWPGTDYRPAKIGVSLGQVRPPLCFASVPLMKFYANLGGPGVVQVVEYVEGLLPPLASHSQFIGSVQRIAEVDKSIGLVITVAEFAEHAR
jgi:hypothetical protein